MTKTIDIEVAITSLAELIAGLQPNDEVVIVQNRQEVARLLPSAKPRQPRKAGNCKGMVTVVAEDDEHLKDFEEYMP